ncbi:MAG: DUF1585 domain-containing protein [Gammaproteobacteria bacterium]|nr:DUF1585 domain-containing protein [Gammaproteobacteria bacterium]
MVSRNANITEFKQILLQDEEAIARSLIEHLVLYATGALVSFADHRSVARILQRSKESGYGLRTLIYDIAKSVLFRKK